MRTKLVYDGSFEGFLSAVFQVYEEKLTEVTIEREMLATETFFTEPSTVLTDPEKANRVWKGLGNYCSTEGKNNIYKTFLSELPGIENTLLHYINRSFSEKKHIDKDFTDPEILKIAKVVKMVGREKHRMDAFVRFRLTKDNLYFATVSPDFNVLPLNAKHFKNRYADQQWLIYDLKRKYGIYYDLKMVKYVELQVSEGINNTSKETYYFTNDEVAFQDLWKNYFKSTNIKSRKNMKLHLQHVPRRYWKYLSEKAPNLKK
ncbi:TIGR03915 family putative DNA repair protein [Rasiella sp. SM2506]|uniref:TIGR03915 family putative DNA repair protein n=1 Tax=Rasiella sp. SM2506 TaxID=3423914 RepID=UPI003D7959A3